jgi:hypothetical protein
MDGCERDRRLDDIFDRYGVNGSQFLGLRDAIETLMDEDHDQAYEDGAEAER